MKKKFLKFGLLLTVALLAVSCGGDDAPTEPPPRQTTNNDNNPGDDDDDDGEEQTGLPALRVEGRFLVDANGNHRNLHGFVQTYSPYFNEGGKYWNNYNVQECLKYNKRMIDETLAAGWKMDFVRMHMDPYWSNNPNIPHTSGDESDISAFDMGRFKTYLNSVFVPMAEYMISKGLYVVMRPPGVCPQNIKVNDDYHKYLQQVWDWVSQHPKLKNNGAVMFELANEPVRIVGSNDQELWGDDQSREVTKYMQAIVNTIRNNDCKNILLVPGLSWQSNYAGFVKFPVEGDNIGYAVHCYPGWYNGGHGDDNVVVQYDSFRQGWNNEITQLARKSPMVVTEMDWAPSKYNSSWGKSFTGVAGGEGFGANFMKLCDDTGNVSWVLFTDPDKLAKYDDSLPDGQTFLTDPEACPRAVYRQYLYYATQEYRDKVNNTH